MYMYVTFIDDKCIPVIHVDKSSTSSINFHEPVIWTVILNL